MGFTRTASGISNYPKFLNADVVVYIEGSTIDEEDIENLIPDRYFYLCLLSSVFGKKSIKVKCVGNKSDVLSYVKPILDSGTKQSIVIIDRDYDGLHCSILENPAIIYTNGYSWENDLWTENVAQAVLSDLTFRNKDSAAKLKQRYSFGLGKLKALSILDASLQSDSQTIFPKNGGGCGIQIDGNSPEVISQDEVKRLILKFKTNPASTNTVVKALTKVARTLESNRLIQGHLWSNLVIKVIIAIYKAKMKEGMLPHTVIQNLILTKFASDPRKYLGKRAYNYYKDEISRRMIV